MWETSLVATPVSVKQIHLFSWYSSISHRYARIDPDFLLPFCYLQFSPRPVWLPLYASLAKQRDDEWVVFPALSFPIYVPSSVDLTTSLSMSEECGTLSGRSRKCRNSQTSTPSKRKCTYVSKMPESGPQPIAIGPSDVIRTYKEYKTNHFPSLYRNSYSSENRSTTPKYGTLTSGLESILSMTECEKPFPGIRRRLGSGAYLMGRVYEPISVVRRLFRDKNDMRKTCKTDVICDT